MDWRLEESGFLSKLEPILREVVEFTTPSDIELSHRYSYVPSSLRLSVQQINGRNVCVGDYIVNYQEIDATENSVSIKKITHIVPITLNIIGKDLLCSREIVAYSLEHYLWAKAGVNLEMIT